MSRIGGQFPFPLQAPANGDGVICLPSGGVYVFPPGNFVCMTGGQTQLQWFDPNQQNWRGVSVQDNTVNQVSSDGCNYRLVNLSGVVLGAVITNAGSGGTNGIGTLATGVAFSWGLPVSGLTLAAPNAFPIVGGSVQAPTIVQAGSQFVMPPLILLDAPPPGGIQATAYATINSAGGIASITMQNVGAGYSSSPNFYVFPQNPGYTGGPVGGIASDPFPPPGLVYPTNLPAGSLYQPNMSLAGCQLSSLPLTSSGTLTGIGMDDYGFGYDGTHIPAIGITGCGAAAATAIMSMCVTSVTLGSAGAGFGAGAPPIWETSLGLVSNVFNNQVCVPRAARGVATVAAGAVASFLIEDPGFGLQKVPSVAVLNTSALSTGQATGTVVCGGVVDFSLVQGRVQ